MISCPSRPLKQNVPVPAASARCSRERGSSARARFIAVKSAPTNAPSRPASASTTAAMTSIDPGPMSNPLHAAHEKAGAEFQPYGQIPIVSTFGEPQAEYAAIRKSAAIIDLPYRGILELTGKDRHVFLNNLLTNQTWDKEKK